MKRVFLDSSVVFKLFKTFLQHGSCNQSKLLTLKIYSFVISTFVVAEVAINIQKKYALSLYPKLQEFLKHTNIHLYHEDTIQYAEYKRFVTDPNDVMIIYHTHKTPMYHTTNSKSSRLQISPH